MARRVAIVRITSDGNPYSMKVIDVERGEEIHVTGLDLSMKAREEFPTVTLTVALPAIDVIAKAEIKQVCPCCGREGVEDG